MTLDEIEKLCRAIDNFDAEETAAECQKNNEWPACLACGGEYRVDTGPIPTALDDGCAHDALTDLARAILLMLPVVRAAVEWNESFGELSKRLPPHVHKLRAAVDEYERAIDTMRAEMAKEGSHAQ